MTSVPEWLHGKAEELEANSTYGNVAQWVRQLADELAGLLEPRPASPQQTQAASSASLSDVTAPS